MSYEQTAFCSAVGRGEEIFWVNPAKKPYEAVKASLPFSHAQIEDAASRLARFAPFLQIKFPETVPTNGLIESPLREIARGCTSRAQSNLKGNFFSRWTAISRRRAL